MRMLDDALILSPSDLSNFLSCRHRGGLDLAVARKELKRPVQSDPYADLLRTHGAAHERTYVEWLRSSGRTILDLTDVAEAAQKTLEAMRTGIDAVVQGRLEGDGLAGYPDILLRVDRHSGLGPWSYEVQDTKLSRETKGGTILQLSAYSDIVATVQELAPERFQVIVPGGTTPFVVQQYRIEDYAAYYRMALATLRSELAKGYEALLSEYYPEAVDACQVCAWEARCVGRRRKDDHLSFIAGIGRAQRAELNTQGVPTLAAAAKMTTPVPFEPFRGSRETYEGLAHQARLQFQQRETQKPVIELLPVQEGAGLCRLPAPSTGDLFLDLEGARFAREGGREYLCGVWTKGGYRAWWALDDKEERAAFEAVVDLIMNTWDAHPDMHVYHFNHYEPTAFKKLMGRHVTKGPEMDRLLRAKRFVDLFPIVRQAARAGVESYSIKQLEQFTGYTRKVVLTSVHEPLLAVQIALDAMAPQAITPEVRDAVQGYNEDDCRSTEFLRDWLETLRKQWEDRGMAVARPAAAADEDEKPVPPVQLLAVALRERILAAISHEAGEPSHADHPKWLLAYLVDWHRREVNAEWWEFFRLKELPEEDLLDERKAVAGLEFVGPVDVVLGKNGKPTGSVIQRYSYPPQEIEVDGQLKCQDGRAFGGVANHDRVGRTLDVRKGRGAVDFHPSCAFGADVVSTEGQQKSVMRLAERMLDGSDECGAQLLFRKPPRLRSGSFAALPGEDERERALRIVTNLERTTLAIQGPPGAGKTHIGAQMIRALVRAGRKVGVSAISHKVIRNLLDEVVAQAEQSGETVRIGVKPKDGAPEMAPVVHYDGNAEAREAITTGQVDVFGGTHFLWTREEFANAVDVLFVDEAGQMSLANVLAVSQAANSLVLLGDPQQLDQPAKATHPDGVGISALEYVLGTAETMPADRGIFLPVTWRMSPTLTAFTSELFYEGKLQSKAGLEDQRLEGTEGHDGSRLWFIPVEHDGNQSASMEEVDEIESLVRTLLKPGTRWTGEGGMPRPLTPQDFRVVAPFNAQVNRLVDRLAALNVLVGTVDKFQGQTAAVVIYSMTTSRPEDAPRGMEFLYSLNRLNVATSRARCAVFLVASPRLFEPDCRTPRQMQLANAMCRYREMSQIQRFSSPAAAIAKSKET